MLLCVVVVFLLCNVWALIANMIEAMSNGKTIDWLVQFSNMLVTINSSVNFVIYVIFGEKFKRLFFKLFFPQGVCGWHPVAGGRNGGGTGGHGGVVDESEATVNGAAVVECQYPGGRSNRASSRRAQHHHHHQHHRHNSHRYNVNERRGTGNTASSALSLYGNDSAAGSGGNGDAAPPKIKREHSTGTAVEESQI